MNRAQVSSYRKTNVHSFVYLDQCPDGNTRPVYENVQTQMTAQSSYYHDPREMNQYGVTSVIRRRRITKIYWPEIAYDNLHELPAPRLQAIREASLKKQRRSEPANMEENVVSKKAGVDKNLKSSKAKRRKRKRNARKAKSLSAGPSEDCEEKSSCEALNSVYSQDSLDSIKELTSKCVPQETPTINPNELCSAGIKNTSQVIKTKTTAESTKHVSTSENIKEFTGVASVLKSSLQIGLTSVPIIQGNKKKMDTYVRHTPCLGVTIKDCHKEDLPKKQWTLFSFLNRKQSYGKHENYTSTTKVENNSNVSNVYGTHKKIVSSRISAESTTNNSWLLKFLSNSLSGKDLYVRWNNKKYKNSSSTLNGLLESVRKNPANPNEYNAKTESYGKRTIAHKNKKLSLITIDFMSNILDCMFKKHTKTFGGVKTNSNQNITEEGSHSLCYSRSFLLQCLRTREFKNNSQDMDMQLLNVYKDNICKIDNFNEDLNANILSQTHNRNKISKKDDIILSQGINTTLSQEQVFKVVEYETIPNLDSNTESEIFKTVKKEIMGNPLSQNIDSTKVKDAHSNNTVETPIIVHMNTTLIPKKSCKDWDLVGLADARSVSTSPSVRQAKCLIGGNVYMLGSEKKSHDKESTKHNNEFKKKDKNKQKTCLASITKPKFKKRMKDYDSKSKFWASKCIHMKSPFNLLQSQIKIKQKQQHTQCDSLELKCDIRINAKDSLQVYKKRRLYEKEIRTRQRCIKSEKKMCGLENITHVNNVACSCNLIKINSSLSTDINEQHNIVQRQLELRDFKNNIDAYLSKTYFDKIPLNSKLLKSIQTASDLPEPQNSEPITYLSIENAGHNKSSVVAVNCIKIFTTKKSRHLKIDTEGRKKHVPKYKCSNKSSSCKNTPRDIKSYKHKNTVKVEHERRYYNNLKNERGKAQAPTKPCGPTEPICSYTRKNSVFSPFDWKKKIGRKEKDLCKSRDKKQLSILTRLKNLYFLPDTKQQYTRSQDCSSADLLEQIFKFLHHSKKNKTDLRQQYLNTNETVVSLASSARNMNFDSSSRRTLPQYNGRKRFNSEQSLVQSSRASRSRGVLVYRSVKSVVMKSADVSDEESDGTSNGKFSGRKNIKSSEKSDGKHTCQCITGKIRRKLKELQTVVSPKLIPKANVSYCPACKKSYTNAIKKESFKETNRNEKETPLKKSLESSPLDEIILQNTQNYSTHSNVITPIPTPIPTPVLTPVPTLPPTIQSIKSLPPSHDCCNPNCDKSCGQNNVQPPAPPSSPMTTPVPTQQYNKGGPSCDRCNQRNSNMADRRCQKRTSQSGHCCYSRSTCDLSISNPKPSDTRTRHHHQRHHQHSNQCKYNHTPCEISLRLLTDRNNSDVCCSDNDIVQNVIIVIGDDEQEEKQQSRDQTKVFKCKPTKLSKGEIEYACELIVKGKDEITETEKYATSSSRRFNNLSETNRERSRKEINKDRKNTTSTYSSSASSNLYKQKPLQTQNKESQCRNKCCSSHCYICLNKSHNITSLVSKNKHKGISGCKKNVLTGLGEEINRDGNSKFNNNHRVFTNYSTTRRLLNYNNHLQYDRQPRPEIMPIVYQDEDMGLVNDKRIKSIVTKTKDQKIIDYIFIMDGIMKMNSKLCFNLQQCSESVTKVHNVNNNFNSESFNGADTFMYGILSNGNIVLPKSRSCAISSYSESMTDTFEVNFISETFSTEQVESNKANMFNDENDQVNVNFTTKTTGKASPVLCLTDQVIKIFPESQNNESRLIKTDAIYNMRDTLGQNVTETENNIKDNIGLMNEITSFLVPVLCDVSQDKVCNLQPSMVNGVDPCRTKNQMQGDSNICNIVTETSSSKDYAQTDFCSGFKKTMYMCKQFEAFIDNVNRHNLNKNTNQSINAECSEALICCLAEYTSMEQKILKRDQLEKNVKIASSSYKNCRYEETIRDMSLRVDEEVKCFNQIHESTVKKACPKILATDSDSRDTHGIHI